MMVEEWLVQAMISMHNKAKIAVNTNYGMSKKFEVNIKVHQE